MGLRILREKQQVKLDDQRRELLEQEARRFSEFKKSFSRACQDDFLQKIHVVRANVDETSTKEILKRLEEALKHDHGQAVHVQKPFERGIILELIDP